MGLVKMGYGLILVMMLGLSACAKYDFAPVELEGAKLSDDPIHHEDKELVEISSTQMKLASSMASFDQDQLDSNKTVVSFQVVNSLGEYLNDLTPTSVTLSENGLSVPNFIMKSNPQESRRTVDIAFLIDVTCSMNPTIASAKTRVIDFIRSSRAAGYHTRMCLSTFGDYTVRHCNRFYDNDPSKTETEAQVNELISEVNALQAGCGSADPGGRDLDENPLQAILDAEHAPWAQGSQRFGILLTDAGFLYGPGNPGSLGSSAPVYANVLSSLQRSQMNLFAATPARAGYERNFGTLPGIIPSSNGEHFPYLDLVNGTTNLNTILNRIMLRVQTTYALEYVADDVSGLNPSLPLNQRTIQVRLVHGTETVRLVSTTSNLPNGRAEYKKSFKLSDKEILASSMKVKVNGLTVTAGYRLNGGALVFDTAPARGAKIEVEYSYSSLADSLQTQPIVLATTEDLNNIAVFLNNTKANGTQIQFQKDLEGRWLLILNPEAIFENDPFKIRENNGLTVKVFRLH